MRKHKPVPRSRWHASQKHLLNRWKRKGLKLERAKIELTLLPLLLQQSKKYPENAAILEIGCGPVCVSQFLPHKHKTFLDPMIDDFRRMFPGELPEEGEYIASTAERIHKESNSYDLVICLNTLSFSLNPELVVNEIERLLTSDGTFILEIRTHSQTEARLHYWAMRLLPQLSKGMAPYCYSLRGIRRTLERHFTVEKEQLLGKKFSWLPFIKRDKRLFICRALHKRTNQVIS